MAPRQRNNISTSSTPTASEDESCSDDVAATSMLKGQKSDASKAKPTQTSAITEADIARDNHDYFNLLALAVVVYTCGLNYEYPSLSYTGGHFWTMWAVSLPEICNGASNSVPFWSSTGGSTFSFFLLDMQPRCSPYCHSFYCFTRKYVNTGYIIIFHYGPILGYNCPHLREEPGGYREGT